MKKMLLSIFVITIILIVGCQQAPKGAIEKGIEDVSANAPEKVTSEEVIDVIESDITTTDSIADDLSVDKLGDVDSGLDEVENI